MERRIKIAMERIISIAKQGIIKWENPFWACILDSNFNIVSISYDKAIGKGDFTAHAEVLVIKEAIKKYNTNNLSWFILLSTCEPCPICFNVAHLAWISKIIYWMSIKDGRKRWYLNNTFSVKVSKRYLKSKIELIPNFMKEECIKLIDLWEKYNL